MTFDALSRFKPDYQQGAPTLMALNLDIATQLDGLKRPNITSARKAIDKLNAADWDYTDAEEALDTWNDLDRDDYDDAEEYQDVRDEKWSDFVDAIRELEAPVEEETPEPGIETPAEVPAAPKKAKAVKTPAKVVGSGVTALLREFAKHESGDSLWLPTPKDATVEQHQKRVASNIGHNEVFKPLFVVRIDRERDGTTVWFKDAAPQVTSTPRTATPKVIAHKPCMCVDCVSLRAPVEGEY